MLLDNDFRIIPVPFGRMGGGGLLLTPSPMSCCMPYAFFSFQGLNKNALSQLRIFLKVNFRRFFVTSVNIDGQRVILNFAPESSRSKKGRVKKHEKFKMRCLVSV